MADNHGTLTSSDHGGNSVAKGQTQLKLAQPSYPAVPLEPLQTERVLKESRDSGWRELSFLRKALRYWLRLNECAVARAIEPANSDEDKEKPIPDEGDGSSVSV